MAETIAAERTSGLKWYHYPEQYRHLLEHTDKHELHVLHSDGLYRHLRFQAPGTGMWHWDLVTWPGSLAIRGDIGVRSLQEMHAGLREDQGSLREDAGASGGVGGLRDGLADTAS